MADRKKEIESMSDADLREFLNRQRQAIENNRANTSASAGEVGKAMQSEVDMAEDERRRRYRGPASRTLAPTLKRGERG